MANVTSVPAPVSSSLGWTLLRTGEGLGDAPDWICLLVFVRVIALLFVMLGLTLYVSPFAAVAIGLVVVVWVAIDTWRELIVKEHEQRARF